jgi:O-antigen/teichoic acid export membrane protein
MSTTDPPDKDAGSAGPEADPTPADAGDSIGRNAAFAFAAQMVTSLATGLLTLYLVRALGPEDFGVLSIAIGLGTLMLLPGDFGVSSSTARFVAEAHGRWDVIGGLVRNALKLKIVATGLLAVGLFALAEPISEGYDQPGLAGPLRWIAVAMFFQSFMQLFMALFVALRRVVVNLRIISSEAICEATTAAAFVLAGGGAAGAAAGRAFGYAVAASLGLWLALRTIGRRNVREGHAPDATRRIFRYAGALVIIDGAFALMVPIGTLILGALLGAAAVGLYAAPARFITFLHYPGLSIANAIAPRLARGEGREPDTQALVTGLRWIMLIQTVLVAPTVVWARPIADILLGEGYERSADVLAVLAPFTFLSGFGPLVSVSVNFLGEARRRVPIALITLAISVTLDLILITQIGLLGGAISTDIAYGFYVLGHLWICKKLLDVPLRPIGRDLVRCLVAAVAMAAVLAAFGTKDLAAWEIIVGGAAGVTVYLVALLALGAVSMDELRGARRFVAGKFRRRRAAGPAS